MSQVTQDRKDERVSAAVTKTEKRAIEWVALTLQEPDGVSGLMRRMSIGAALELHDEMRAKLGMPEPAETGTAA